MNNYVSFDTLKYIAPHLAYAPMRNKPATERITLSGASDVTYGPGVILEWIGQLIAPVTPNDTGWGDIDDLRDSLEKREPLALIDHYGVASTVYAFGPHGETSFTPMWDAESNEFRVTVRFVVDQGGGALVPLATLNLASSVSESAALGGAVTTLMDSLVVASSLEYMFTSRPVILEELYVVSSANMEGVPQVMVMDTLSTVSSVPAMTVT